jgi:predicted ester cyclase
LTAPRRAFAACLPLTDRSFVEHVFYQYRYGRIAQIWSMNDMDAIRAQLRDER